jgi:biopolymer transport protein ExbD
MGMNVGGGGQRADINVTPMIDVLLVLIIIFLVITPTAERGLHTLIPQPSNVDLPKNQPIFDLVVSVAKGNVISINQEPVDLAALPQKLASLYVTAHGAHFFVRGDRDIDFEEVAKVIDAARGAGWNQIGLMTR